MENLEELFQNMQLGSNQVLHVYQYREQNILAISGASYFFRILPIFLIH